jgi:hypothetical protein
MAPRAPRAATAALLAAALGLSACGGGDSSEGSDSGEDFTAAADAICAEAAEAAVDSYTASLEGPPEQAGQAYIEGLLEARDAELTQLRELEPAGDDADRYASYLDLREQATETLRAANEPGQEDPAAADVDSARAEELRMDADEVGAELGFEACANRLPETDEEAIAETIEQTTSADDAEAICRDLSTERFQSRFGGVEKCIKAQAKGSSSQSAEVVDVLGVSGVSADAMVELGDRGGDQLNTFTVDLLFEDGAWKLERIEPTG